jgi:hypothetical protein
VIRREEGRADIFAAAGYFVPILVVGMKTNKIYKHWKLGPLFLV